ncbi:N-acetylmuramate alpha-1-phosphate uridylyltransferase MurU [Spiribacter vilamensis]|uniref:MurNAc alpha-1-phosphate uridylyltransferase n=1 Tax=Spiribacter vilamensis TaxID=531306 RepID=A0A4Q8CXZ7_9GAMM|nr:nucleotidyltransferase family protein [Spiribacter vilamensis]RZU97836.1 MurNAc alpha-1-phosphate uridylyltransferase [Spiribacter vilamensis]TVO61240.1 nucleotidyltransferase family protein [Spiribacter vilamensis]
MNAMILAAGRGERMRPLSDHCPKPLLSVGGRTLLDWHLARLAASGFERVVINTAWLGDAIRDHVARHAPEGLEVRLSDEGDRALETAGGIVRALPLLGSDPFVVINGDVWSDFDPAMLPTRPEGLGHLVLVDNPEHHPDGDFRFDGYAVVSEGGDAPRYTFAGIACYRPELFAGVLPGVAPLAPILHRACERRQLTGHHHAGQWCDVGTPARLATLDARLSRR